MKLTLTGKVVGLRVQENGAVELDMVIDLNGESTITKDKPTSPEVKVRRRIGEDPASYIRRRREVYISKGMDVPPYKGKDRKIKDLLSRWGAVG